MKLNNIIIKDSRILLPTVNIETKAQFSRKSEWKSQEQFPSSVDVDLSIRSLVPRAIFKDSLLDLTWRDFQVWSIGLSGMIHTKISVKMSKIYILRILVKN